ncbi:MAG TPA: acyl-CoA dehydrogenase family protein [Tepidiformaceae bacterium]|jgi:alkylation response protein AidB-like acyl-CoA dehydrogenase
MRLVDSPEEATWRTTVRDFIVNEIPASMRGGAEEDAETAQRGPELRGRERPQAQAGGAGFQLAGGAMGELRKKMVANGWIAPSWPKKYGGADLTVMQQFILSEEFAEARAPRFGVPLVGPTLVIHGSEEQKEEFLPPILRGENRWCQGFSEPGSGSDLASLQTRAVRDGDDYVLNGQKIWTTGAHRANMMFMIARTNPDAPKHRGITYFILDMKTPGITVSPLVNAAGRAEFNEVFFDDVRVPAKNVVGEENRGWYVATTTLDFERSGIGNAVGTKQNVESLINWAKANANIQSGQSALKVNPAVRLELTDRLVEANVAKMLSYRVVDLQNRGRVPNYEASMCKMYSSELNQRIARTGIKMIGLYGVLWGADTAQAPNHSEYSFRYVRSLSATIAGGTSEIQRNIIAERGMGLPRG